MLIEVGTRLKREGVVEVAGEEIPVPGDVELEVEYEEEPWESEFEVEIERRPGDESEVSAEEEPLPPYDDVKECMEDAVEQMRRAVAAGRELPDRAALDRFLELNEKFERYAESEPYADRMEEYSAEVKAMAATDGDGDLERFHGRLEKVRALTDACHAEYG